MLRLIPLFGVDEQYFGKPENKEESQRNVEFQLSGKRTSSNHFSLLLPKKINSNYTLTKPVRLLSRNFRVQEIEYYVNEFKPMDKAGAYGIQEWIGTTAIEKIKGSYTNIVGLPMAQVLQYLEKLTSN